MPIKYSDKSIKLEEIIEVEKKEPTYLRRMKTLESEDKTNIELKISEVLNMAIGYTTSEHLPITLGIDNTIGKCLICKVGTNAIERCICYECHAKHIKNIYKKMDEALAKGEFTIKYEY